MVTRVWKDRVVHKSMILLCFGVLSLAFLMAFGLLARSSPILLAQGPARLFQQLGQLSDHAD